jgi:hypothetical protein
MSDGNSWNSGGNLKSSVLFPNSSRIYARTSWLPFNLRSKHVRVYIEVGTTHGAWHKQLSCIGNCIDDIAVQASKRGARVLCVADNYSSVQRVPTQESWGNTIKTNPQYVGSRL